MERTNEELAAIQQLQDEHTYTSSPISGSHKWCTMCDPTDPLPTHESDCPFARLRAMPPEGERCTCLRVASCPHHGWPTPEMVDMDI